MKKALILKGDSCVSVRGMFALHGFKPFFATDPDLGIPDVIVFTGGSDVSPYLYGEENISSSCDPIRDEYERQVYEKFSELGIPMVGICRGGQFLNVMNGGKMLQHISGHSYRDAPVKIELSDPEIDPEGCFTTTIREDHHQGMVESDSPSYILGVDAEDGNSEIIWYDKTRCFCFQGHPEWGHPETEEVFFRLMEYCLPELFDASQDD